MTDMDSWNLNKIIAEGYGVIAHTTNRAREWIVAHDYRGGLLLQKAQEEADRQLDITRDFADEWVRDEGHSYRGGVEEMRETIPFLNRWYKL